MRQSERAEEREREKKRGVIQQLEQWSRISCHDTVVPTHALCSTGPHGIAKLDLSIMSRGSEKADDRMRG